MRLVVLGATGGTGRKVVDVALARGMDVTAVVRDPARLGRAHERLRVVVGDVTDEAFLQGVVAGADAVISALGQQRGTPATLMQDAASALIDAMRATGVRRVLALSGAGVSMPGDPPPALGMRLSKAVLRVVLPRLILDTQAYADRFRASGLDWTLARPMWLTDGPGGRTVTAAPVLDLGLRASIDRADVATFLVDQIGSDAWVGAAPMLSAA